MIGDTCADGTFLQFKRVGALDIRLAWDLPNVKRLVLPKGNLEEAKRQLEVVRVEKEGSQVEGVKKKKSRRLRLVGVSSMIEAINKVFLDRPVDEGPLAPPVNSAVAMRARLR